LDFNHFREELEKAFTRPLPGQDAQYQMTPAGRERVDLKRIDQEKVKQAATAALFFPMQNRPHLILTRRVEYPGVHSGQISFPGGRREPEDESFMDTALRETHEEIGVKAGDITLLGSLTALYIPPSNFFVYPFVGILDQKPEFFPQESEVAEILSLDFNLFLPGESLKQTIVDARGFKLKVPAFNINGHIIWGATAMMISELRAMFTQRAPNLN
tara:strand:- start:810 stop:1454 length:645 start_codon:yes stop_codon:yes gene_type:complete